MKNITLISCLDLTGYTHDDDLFIKELQKQGHRVNVKPWETLIDEGEDLFIIRTTWNYTEHLDAFLVTLEKIKDRLINSIDLVKWNSNKAYLFELESKGVNTLPSKLVHDKNSLTQATASFETEDFILKPLVSASAKGLVRFHKENLSKVEIESEMILQPFYPEILDGEISLIYFAGEFSHALRKTPKANEFRVQDEYGGSVTSHKPLPEEIELANDAIKCIPGEWVYVRVDIVPGVGLIELECIEPALYFGASKESAARFAKVITSKTQGII